MKFGSIIAILLLFVSVASCNQDIAGTSNDDTQSAQIIHYSVGDNELCPAGTYSSDGTGPDCTPAPVGTYVPEAGSTVANACEIGTYQDEIGQTSCKLAEPGSFVNFQGAASASLCPVGTFSDSYGATECTVCPEGSTNFGPGSTACYFNPEDKIDCKNGGWDEYGFKNQGQCIRFVNTGKDSRN